jgi:hypothetical protein
VEWCKLYANLPDDPRIQAAEDDGAAGWLLVQSFCYVTRAESLIDGEGFIPDTQVRRFGCIPEQVAALVRERLYIRDDLRKGYLLDPEIWNEDRNLSDSAEKKRTADRERMRAKREAARAAQNGHVSRDSRATSRATASRDSRALDERREEKTRTKTLSLVDVNDQSSRRNARGGPIQLPLVAALSDRYGRVLDDDDLLKTTIGSIKTRTGRVLDAAKARDIAADILDAAKRQVGDPIAYVRKAIEGEPDPAARWLARDTEHVAPPREPWCRQCSDDVKRQVEDPDGKLRRCPNCHPLRSAS